MSEIRIVVDHLRLNYNGPFDANGLFKHITAFLKERGWDLKTEKEFENNTSRGKHIEWQINCWFIMKFVFFLVFSLLGQLPWLFLALCPDLKRLNQCHILQGIGQNPYDH